MGRSVVERARPGEWQFARRIDAPRLHVGQAVAVEANQGGIPGGGQTGQCRKGYARVVGLSGLLPFVPENVGANTMGTVVSPEVGVSV